MKRRELLKLGISAGTIFGLSQLSKANDLCTGKTPDQTEGPFYPITHQDDTDWDLTQVKGHNQKAIGDEIIVMGHVTDQNCNSISEVLVEIWQACQSGKYNHANDPNSAPLDPHFQYWGKSITDKNGLYFFKTIIPGAYPADTNWTRPSHIHFKIHKRGYMELTTQLYFANFKFNETDKILSRLPKKDQLKVICPIESMEFQLPGEQKEIKSVVKFNIEIEKL